MTVLSGNVSVLAVGVTIYVDDDNTGGSWDGTVLHPYQNITSGIEHALFGDTVYVFGGTYGENVVVDKSITLRGDSKPIINGLGGIGINITVYDNFVYGVAVDGFNITNCSYGIHLVMQDIAIDVTDLSVTIGDIILDNNAISSNLDGIFLDVHDVGVGMYGNSSVAIGDFRVTNNVINSGTVGIYAESIAHLGEDLYDDSSFTMGNMQFNGNQINSDEQGIRIVYMDYFGYNMEGSSSFTMGNIELSGNIINSGWEGIFIYDISEFGRDMYDSSSFAMGSILVNNNIIITSGAGAVGIYVDYIRYFGEYMHGASSFTMGNIEFSGNEIVSVDKGIEIGEISYFGSNTNNNAMFAMGNVLLNDNTISSNNDGIYVDYLEYFGNYMYGESSFTMGNIELSGNIINSTYYGICAIELAYEFGYEMYGKSSFTMGHIRVNENVINNEGVSTGNNAGIYVEYIEYLGNYMYNMSTFVMGNIEVSDNRINSTTHGIYLYEIDYFGYQMYNDSSFAMGEILVNDNIINSAGYHGMYLEYIWSFGYVMYGNSSFTMGNVQINGNVVNSAQRGIFIEDLEEFGAYMHDTSSFTMSNIEISGNRINSTLEGIYIQSFYLAYYMYNNASFTIEDILVNDNIINSKDNGIVLRQIWPRARFGYNAIDNATIITGNVEFGQNEITGGIDGIDLADLENATIRNNMIQNCDLGIYLQDSANNSIYHNNFINNTLQAYVRALYTSTPNCNNTWDNGYPSGGNYWSDYTGTDLYSGPDQDIAGSDFRGDTPYTINQNNTDRYPLTIPYETQPPTIIILSPENTTYAVDTDIQLTFTLDEPVDWIGYSLDDEVPVTITGNITLPALSIGGHRVTVYANDTFNNMGTSTVYFTVFDFTDPIANASSDRTVNEDVSTTLDGSASTDNVGITGYTWTFTDVTLKILTGDKPAYTFSNPGVYTITLNVTDAAENWAIDTLVITVLDVTDPMANAGQDQTVNVRATVSFDAGGSTDNVGIVSYEWDFGDETSGTGITATHEYTNAGTYTVTLTVDDAAGNQATDTLVVVVNPTEAFPWWIVAVAGIVAVGIVAAAVILWRRRKKT